jgi:small nuclear ribonucleoprotein (snRNP)-like protein
MLLPSYSLSPPIKPPPIYPPPLQHTSFQRLHPLHLPFTSLRNCSLSLTSHQNQRQSLIRLKWGQTEYKGRLISADSYMNIQLSNTEEFIDGKSTGSLGQVLIRYVFLRLTVLFGGLGRKSVWRWTLPNRGGLWMVEGRI